MKTVYLKTANFDQWAVQVLSIQKQGCVYYRFSIFGRSDARNQYDTLQIYPTEETAYQAAYFFCLRASLDREPDPSMIVDHKSGYILSINLPAFDLLKINAVGLNVIDFTIDLEDGKKIHQEFQKTGKINQKIIFQNADGHWIECRANTQVAPDYSEWAIVRLTSITSVQDKIFCGEGW
jgi:hypothetical protein